MHNKIKIYRSCYVSILFVTLFALNSKCSFSNEPLLSFLTNSRSVVILKGSYASDAPLEFSEINANRLFVDDENNELNGICDAAGSNRSTDRSCLTTPNNSNIFSLDQLPIYIDFAGIRLSLSQEDLASVDSLEETDDFWHILSNSRRIYCNRPDNLLSGNSCSDSNGVGDLQNFFNGRGALYPSSIITNQTYFQAGVYIRRLVFGYGRLINTNFRTNGNGQRTGDETIVSVANTVTNLDGANLNGRDIVSTIGFVPGSGAPNPNTSLSLVFPILFRAASGQSIVFEDNYEPAVFEFRMGLKEILSYHALRLQNLANFVSCDATNSEETWAANSTISSNYIFLVAPSDWRVKHNINCQFNEWGLWIGGNLLTRARIFYPLQTSNIIISNTGTNPNARMYALFSMSEPARDQNTVTAIDPTHATSTSRTLDQNSVPSVLPLAATPARTGNATNKINQLRYIMPGSYILQCRADNNNDGFPETVISVMNVTVPNKASGSESQLSEVAVSFNC